MMFGYPREFDTLQYFTSQMSLWSLTAYKSVNHVICPIFYINSSLLQWEYIHYCDVRLTVDVVIQTTKLVGPLNPGTDYICSKHTYTNILPLSNHVKMILQDECVAKYLNTNTHTDHHYTIYNNAQYVVPSNLQLVGIW